MGAFSFCFVFAAGKNFISIPRERDDVGDRRLLINAHSRYLLSVGAIATILGLAVEPALQAIINTRGQLDPILSGAQASITKCQKYDSGLEEIQLRSSESS